MDESRPPSNRDGIAAVERRSKRSTLVAILTDDVKNRLSQGDRAELRRMRYDGPACPAFWKLAAVRLDADLGDRNARRWASIISGIAATADLKGAPSKLGKALAFAGVAEARVLKLLRARGDALLDAVRTTAQQLSSTATPVDWADVAKLVFSDGGPKAEKIRRAIAGDYYRNVGAAAAAPAKEDRP